MIKNIYKIKLTTFSFSILLLVMFLLFQTALGATDNNQSSKYEGTWEQVGYGRVVEIKGEKVKFYDNSNVSCVFVEEEKLSNIGNVVKAAKNSIIIKSGINNLEFKRIKKLPNLCSQNADKKNDPLFNFDSLWHTFNEQYAYFKTRNIDWDAYYKKYRSRLSSNSTEVELYEVIKEMLDSMKDGHINFKAPAKVRKAYAEKNKSTAKKEMSDVERILTSQKLTEAIAKKYAKNIKTYNSGVLRWGMIEGDVAYLQINFMFLMTKQKSIPDEVPFIEFIQKYFQIIEENPGQVFAEAIGASKAIKTVLKDTKNAKAFIIDIRFNPGGTDSVPLAFLSHFTNSRKKVFTKKARLKNGFTKPQEIFVNPATPQFIGNVYLLTSHQSASGAEIMSISTNVFPNIKRIGSNTQGIFSDVLEKKLPNGWKYSLSNEVYQDLKGVDYENKGIPPHYEIKYPKEPEAFFEQVSNELKDGDKAIEKALNLIRGKTSAKKITKDKESTKDQKSNAEIAGKWTMTAEVQGQEFALTLDLKQNGSTFTGTIKTPYGNGTIDNGKLSGNELSAKVNITAAGQDLALDMRGKVTDEVMTGTLDGDGIPNVNFFATKTKAKQITISNYSGIWKLDITQSKLHERSRLESAVMTVSQTKTDITIKKKTKLKSQQLGSINLTSKDKVGEKCKLNGTEVNRDVESDFASGTVTTICKLNDSGKLIVSKTALITIPQRDAITTVVNDIWTLSKDGKTLTIESKSEANSRTVETTMVFTKH